MSYWGYAFEAAATASEEPGSPVDCNAEFCAIAKTKLGGNRIIVAGEVDCERGAADQTGRGSAHAMRQYVELKTTKLLTDERSRRTFERYKLSKWFLQSYLLGVQTILCGFRDNAGVLKKTQEFECRKLPEYGRGAWQPHVMLNFGAATLSWLHQRIMIGPPSAKYLLTYEPATRRITLTIAPEGKVPFLAPAIGGVSSALTSAAEPTASTAGEAAARVGDPAMTIEGGRRSDLSDDQTTGKRTRVDRQDR
jgi:RAT1-interacting protein